MMMQMISNAVNEIMEYNINAVVLKQQICDGFVNVDGILASRFPHLYVHSVDYMEQKLYTLSALYQ